MKKGDKDLDLNRKEIISIMAIKVPYVQAIVHAIYLAVTVEEFIINTIIVNVDAIWIIIHVWGIEIEIDHQAERVSKVWDR